MRPQLFRALTYPYSTRLQLLALLDRAFNFLSYDEKIAIGAIERPHYGHCLLQSALQARALGHESIAAIELGVSGGRGLLALERHAERVEAETGVKIQVYGFDLGSGMPKAADYRDLPYVWQAGFYRMDVEALRARLSRATLVIGPVEETLKSFFQTHNPAPLGFVAFDMDYYSSTSQAWALFSAEPSRYLPRVACYFDDIVGDLDYGFNDFTGELLAISEFNATHSDRKLARPSGLRHSHKRVPMSWHEQIFLLHLFEHPAYCRLTNTLHQQQPLPPSSKRLRIVGD